MTEDEPLTSEERERRLNEAKASIDAMLGRSAEAQLRSEQATWEDEHSKQMVAGQVWTETEQSRGDAKTALTNMILGYSLVGQSPGAIDTARYLAGKQAEKYYTTYILPIIDQAKKEAIDEASPALTSLLSQELSKRDEENDRAWMATNTRIIHVARELTTKRVDKEWVEWVDRYYHVEHPDEGPGYYRFDAGEMHVRLARLKEINHE